MSDGTKVNFKNEGLIKELTLGKVQETEKLIETKDTKFKATLVSNRRVKIEFIKRFCKCVWY